MTPPGSSSHLRITIIGGGIFGQVVAWRLARRGAQVTLVEAVATASWESGSGDRSRIVRAMYGEPRFAESGAASLELFAQWSRELQVPMVEACGVIYLEHDEDDGAHATFTTAMDAGMSSLASLGRRFEVLTPGAAARRWPALSPSGLRRVVLEPDGGYGRAALATRALARAGQASGVRHVAARILAVVRKGVGFRVEGVEDRASAHGAGGGHVLDVVPAAPVVIEADAVVIAAGFAGAALVAPHLTAPLPIRRIPHFTTYWDVPEAEAAPLALGAIPVWAELGAGLYGFPDDGESGFKVAWHAPSWGADGDASGPPEDTEWLRRAVAVRFAGMQNARLRNVYRCAYDATADEGFLIGEVPGAPRLWFVGGMSGHGFKHAPAIGESVALAMLGEAPLLDLSSYALPALAT